MDVVRRCLAARGRGDYAAAAELFDPEIVVDLTERPDGGRALDILSRAGVAVLARCR